MGTVTIPAAGGTVYQVYGEHVGADSLTAYANASLAYAAIFTAASVDDRARAHVEATRVLDRAPWAGAKTSGAQALAWPRTGVTRADGTAVDSVTIPAEVTTAAYELALAGLADPSIFTGVTTADNTKKLEAKGVSIEYFGPQAGGRWPGRVGELVSQFLAGMGASALGGSAAYGTSSESSFDDCDRFDLTGAG